MFLTEDITIDTNAYVVLNTGGRFYGQGYTITVSNVTNFNGLFELNGGKIIDLHVVQNNSTIASQAGWLAKKQAYGFIERCSSDGAIPSQAGGIAGADTALTVTKLTLDIFTSTPGSASGTGTLTVQFYIDNAWTTATNFQSGFSFCAV